MTQLKQYLNSYQSRDDRETVIVEILCMGLELRAYERKNKLTASQKRRLGFQWKKWRSQLITEVFYQLPSLSRPRREIWEQYREEFDSICNEVAAEFVSRILDEFDPKMVTQSSHLTAKLTIWVNSKLRLKWRILDVVTPQRKTKEVKLLEIIVELNQRSPDGFTKTDFLIDVKRHTKFDLDWATEYLLELLPRFWSTAPEGDRYFLDHTRLQNHLDSLAQKLYTTSLDPAIAEQLTDPLAAIPAPQTPTLSQKITRLLAKYHSNLKTLCVKNNPDCHCSLLLEKYFQQQLYDVKINEENIVRLLGIKRATYQSHLERKCLPTFWELAIETSPVSQPDPNTQTILLKDYVHSDEKRLLRKCHYIDSKQQPKPDCNCQNLAQKKLECITPKPEKWKTLALCYKLTTDTLVRFWKMKCLFLLSLIVFELEAEHTDYLEVQ